MRSTCLIATVLLLVGTPAPAQDAPPATKPSATQPTTRPASRPTTTQAAREQKHEAEIKEELAERRMLLWQIPARYG